MAGISIALVVMLLTSTVTVAILAAALFFLLRPAKTDNPSSPAPILPKRSAPHPAKRKVIANDDAAAYRAEVKEREKAQLS